MSPADRKRQRGRYQAALPACEAPSSFSRDQFYVDSIRKFKLNATPPEPAEYFALACIFIV